MFEQAFAEANLPGAVGMIVDRDGVRYAEALGQADAVGGVAMARDTLFQIASMTKALTSVAAMQLVDHRARRAPARAVLRIAVEAVFADVEVEG